MMCYPTLILNALLKLKYLDIMTANDNINDAVTDRLQESSRAWALRKKKLVGKEDLNTKLRIQFESLITSILLYIQHIQVSETSAGELRCFRSKCAGLIFQGFYGKNNEHIANVNIRSEI